MSNKIKSITALASALTVVIAAATSSSAVYAEAQKNILEEGKKLSFTRAKGNCLACHMIPGGESPGNIAPPLISMKMRYPDKTKLRDQIWDASKKNLETAMPLFGRYEILSESELDKVVEYIYSL